MRYRKTYSLERAFALHPLLARIAGEMTMRCRRIARLRGEYRAIRNASDEGALNRVRCDYETERAAFETCVRELEALGGGLVSHDPVTIHLLGELQTGVRVVLCWSFGEKAIASYHPVGFEDSPRQPLAPPLAAPPILPSLPATGAHPSA